MLTMLLVYYYVIYYLLIVCYYIIIFISIFFFVRYFFHVPNLPTIAHFYIIRITIIVLDKLYYTYCISTIPTLLLFLQMYPIY